MASVRIETGDITHLDDIVALESGFGLERYSRQCIEGNLNNQNCTNLILYVDNVASGYLCASCVLDECEVLKIIVDKEHREMGLGTMLMQKLFECLKSKGIEKVFLEFRVDNVVAKSFYESIGFESMYRREKYYSDGVDAFVYRYNLNGKSKL